MSNHSKVIGTVGTATIKSTIISALFILFYPYSWVYAFPASFGLSPDNSLELLESVLNSAQKSLTINIYQFEHPQILKTIVKKMNEGVKIELLVEGDPWALKPDGQKILKQVQTAMLKKKRAGQHLYLMSVPSKDKPRRFKLDHAKYIIADKKKAWISSENFSTHALPDAGKIGNRGWQVVLEDPKVIQELQKTFDSDTSLSFGDIQDLTSSPLLEAEAETYSEGPSNSSEHSSKSRNVPSVPIGSGDVQSAALVMSPHSEAGIEHMIQSARSNLELEFMSLPNRWKDEQGNEVYSPIVNQIIASARKGVEVRVLLNDESVFRKEPPKKDAPMSQNEFTVALLQRLSICENLKMAAKIVNVKDAEITYIHNKGILADHGYAFVSSINGTRQSVTQNREVGIILQSKAANDYFSQAFDFDWENSENYKLKGSLKCNEKNSGPKQNPSEEVFFLDEAFQEQGLGF